MMSHLGSAKKTDGDGSPSAARAQSLTTAPKTGMSGEGEPSTWEFDRGSYTFEFVFKQHEQQEVFKGHSNTILPYSKEDATSVLWRTKPKDLTIVYFADEDEKKRYCRWATTVGKPAYLADFKCLMEKGLYGIGRPTGVPLLRWITRSGLEIWKIDTNNCRWAGDDLKKIGRWLGAALYFVHRAGNFVGDLLRSTYVDERAQRVSFLRKDKPQYYNLSPEDGIKADLSEFVRFVDVVSTIPNGSVTITNGTDVDMFYDLWRTFGNLPSDIDELKSISYFLCHAPLYWYSKQRQAFCYTYWSLRQHNENDFDNHVPFTNPKVNDSWYLDVYKLPKSFALVFSHQDYIRFKRRKPTGTQMRHLLIPFHRSCLQHGNQTPWDTLSLDQIDAKLLEVFPDAIPIAYNELYRSLKFSREFKLTCLRDGPRGIDYSKFI